MTNALTRAYPALFLLALVGCSTTWRPIVDGSIGSVPGKAMVADYRLVTLQNNPKDSTPTKHNPILCAEPSPDIARAFSSAISASLTTSVAKAGADGSTANFDAGGSFQSQTAQAIAQLGKRYATVQVLRDILHDQCMQYANGAMSESTWAILQSRFNSLVVTMLALEMVSGDTAPAPTNVSQSTDTQTGTDNGKGGGTINASKNQTDAAVDSNQSATKATTVQQFTAAQATVATAKSAYSAFVKSVGKVSAAAKAASASDDLKDASKAFAAANGAYKTSIADLTKAWNAVTAANGKPDAGAKALIDAFTKSIPSTKDKTVIAAASAAASAATADTKAAASSMTKLSDGLTAASTKLTALGVTGKTTPAPGDGTKNTGKAASSISDAQAAAITQIHAMYLSKEDLGPSLLGCFTYLDPPDRTMQRNAEPLLTLYCGRILNARIEEYEKEISNIGTKDQGDIENSLNPKVIAVTSGSSGVPIDPANVFSFKDALDAALKMPLNSVSSAPGTPSAAASSTK